MSLEKTTYASVAQLVEQETENLRVAGSTPARGTISEGGTLLAKHRQKRPATRETTSFKHRFHFVGSSVCFS